LGLLWVPLWVRWLLNGSMRMKIGKPFRGAPKTQRWHALQLCVARRHGHHRRRDVCRSRNVLKRAVWVQASRDGAEEHALHHVNRPCTIQLHIPFWVGGGASVVPVADHRPEDRRLANDVMQAAFSESLIHFELVKLNTKLVFVQKLNLNLRRWQGCQMHRVLGLSILTDTRSHHKLTLHCGSKDCVTLLLKLRLLHSYPALLLAW